MIGRKKKWILAVAAGLAIAAVALVVAMRAGAAGGKGKTAGAKTVAGPREPRTGKKIKQGPTYRIKSPLVNRKTRITSIPSAVSRLHGEKPGSRKEAREYMPDRDGRVAAAIASIRTELAKATTSEQKLKLIGELAEKCHPDAIGIVSDLLSDPDPDVRSEALWALEGYADPAVVPVAMAALNDPDPDVRQAALAAISGVKDPVVKEAIEKALDDPEEPVRDMALEVAADLGTRIRLEIYERNLHSEYDSVKIGTIEKLEDMGNPYAFEVLLEGLRDKSPQIRKFTNESIYFLVSENFKSYDEAKSWWDANRDRYDENLFEKE